MVHKSMGRELREEGSSSSASAMITLRKGREGKLILFSSKLLQPWGGG